MKNIIDNYSSSMSSYEFFNRDAGEPNTDGILELYKKVADYSPDCLVAIGGGSTIDTVKLIWLLYEYPEFDLENSAESSKQWILS